MRQKTATMIIVGVGLIAGAAPLHAQSYRYVDDAGSDTANDCLNPATPCQTVGHALAAAGPGDTLEVAAGVYTETLNIASNVAIRGEDEATTIIQANASPQTASSRVVTISGQPDVRISDVTIRHGQAFSASGGKGAGLFCNGGGLVLESVTFTLNHVTGINTADSGGGGLYLVNGDNAVLTDVTFSENSVVNRQGGGMYTSGGDPMLIGVTFVSNTAFHGKGAGLYNENGSPTLTNVAFDGNGDVGDGDGGGMFSFQGSPILTNVVFSGNLAENAGGMYVDGDTVTSAPALSEVTFTGNSATRAAGMFNDNGSSPTLDGVSFVGNAASQLAGGLVNEHSSSPVLRNVVFDNNTSNFAGSAGGMFNNDNSNPMLVNVLFVGNSGLVTSNFTVGGMKNDNGSSPTLVNVTFSGNSGHIAGALYNQFDSDPVLTNVIMWDNEAEQGSAVPEASIWNGVVTSQPVVSHSLIANSGGSDAWDSALGIDGGNNIDEDPEFVDPFSPDALSKSWGTTAAGNLRLLPTSPAVDAGDPATDLSLFPTDDSANPVDLDGNARTFGGGLDLGAYEYPGFVLPVELSSFSATVDAGQVLLTWQTSSETNNAGFEVQRSVDGDLFEALDFVDGNGTTQHPHDYSFTDKSLPFEARGIAYRLKQVDFDGSFSFSPIVEVGAEIPLQLVLHGAFPNPVSTTTTIRYELQRPMDVQLLLYDATGRQLDILVEAPQEAGRNGVRFDASDLASGLYLYQLRTDQGMQRTGSLVVTR